MKNKKIIVITAALLMLGSFLIVPNPLSFAEENTEDLKQQIEELRAEVADLKAAANPRVTTPQDDLLNGWGYGSSASWDPFAEMRQMQDRMNRLFRDSYRRTGSQFGSPGAGLASFYEPDLDVEDNKDHYVMTLDLPGMDKEKINVEVTEHDIVISGERNYETEEQDDAEGFYRMERRFGSFSRRLPLPENATPNGVNAKYDKGVLEIKIPKKEPEEPKEESKRIKIK